MLKARNFYVGYDAHFIVILETNSRVYGNMKPLFIRASVL